MAKQDLCLKCSAWKGFMFIPSLQWKFQCPKQILGKKKIWVQKNFGSTKNFGSKNFWAQGNCGYKKNVDKNFGSEKIFQNNFWCEKI